MCAGFPTQCQFGFHNFYWFRVIFTFRFLYFVCSALLGYLWAGINVIYRIHRPVNQASYFLLGKPLTLPLTLLFLYFDSFNSFKCRDCCSLYFFNGIRFWSAYLLLISYLSSRILLSCNWVGWWYNISLVTVHITLHLVVALLFTKPATTLFSLYRRRMCPRLLVCSCFLYRGLDKWIYKISS